MAFIDYYKILGVARDIPQKDVRKAYLKRAKLFHPDLHPDDPKAKAKFQALTEAFDVINDAMPRPTNEPAAEPVALIIGAVVVAKAPSKALISADSVVAVVASPISSVTCLVLPVVAEHLNGAAECVRVK